MLVVGYQCFEQPISSICKAQALPLMVVSVGYFKTSVFSYQPTQCNIPEEQRA